MQRLPNSHLPHTMGRYARLHYYFIARQAPRDALLGRHLRTPLASLLLLDETGHITVTAIFHARRYQLP